MKKHFLILLLVVAVLFSGICYAQGPDYMDQSAEYSVSAAVITTTNMPFTKGMFHGIVIATDGTNSATLIVYDHATGASGTKLMPIWVVTARMGTFSYDPPVPFSNGVYVDYTCAGTATYMVLYSNFFK